ncbi:MAG TPA: DoxX family protein [Gammaproteobacteria bacterium]|nr:DoxX family protein [Gammaproteobacteria bacterium]
MKDSALLLGRILIAAIFIASGYSKITGYAGMAQYIASLGVPGALLPLVILWELGGGIAILLGLFTRPVALSLAVYCVLTAVLVHYHPADQMQMINFMKNLTMTGGFIYVAATGAGAFSLDKKLKLKWA